MPTYLISKAQKENKSEDLFYFFEKKSPQNRGFDKDRERDDAFRRNRFYFPETLLCDMAFHPLEVNGIPRN